MILQIFPSQKNLKAHPIAIKRWFERRSRGIKAIKECPKIKVENDLAVALANQNEMDRTTISQEVHKNHPFQVHSSGSIYRGNQE